MSTFDGHVKEFPHIRIDNFLHNGPLPLACFLSHVHSDHLRGLETLKSPFVYCSAATRELLLRLEKFPHRMNFARGVLEVRKQTYRHLKKILRPIPLNTPTILELAPGNDITVTLFDANHCTGAVMFMIEGQGKAILYTGDIRSETWWIDALKRHPCILPYATGQKTLDKIYLDTTFASSRSPYRRFASKSEGLAELLEKVAQYENDTIFYFNAWTFGYEDVWIALAKALDTKVHLDPYRQRLYHSLTETRGIDASEAAPLVGFQFGNTYHAGCTTSNETGARIHSCERGDLCDAAKQAKVVTIIPILTRHNGIEYQEAGAGGGHGDLDQIHELEMDDIAAVGRLMQLCDKRLRSQPDLLKRVQTWLAKTIKDGGANVRIDTTSFLDAVQAQMGSGLGDDIPLDMLVTALDALLGDKGTGQVSQRILPSRYITFPYSRHSSYEELRQLVKAFRPHGVFPNTIEPGMDMEELFGDLLCRRDQNANDPKPIVVERSLHSMQPQDANTRSSPIFEPSPSITEGDVYDSKAVPSSPRSSDSICKSETRKRPSKHERHRSASRRLRTYESLLGDESRSWATDVHLGSTSKSYHNQGKEMEL